MNDDFDHPANPFPVSEAHAETTFALINAAIETWALMGIPITGSETAHLVVMSAIEWARRATGEGDEDRAHALVWELSVWLHRLSQEGLPFPPYDGTTRCGNDECDVDHSEEVRAVNALFMASLSGDYAGAVRAYSSRVWGAERDPEDCMHERRIRAVAMFLVHTAERVSQFRRRDTEEMDKLIQLFGDTEPS